MKQWFLGRGQTLLSLVILLGIIWGAVLMVLKLLDRPDQNQTVTALIVALLGVVASLTAVAIAIGKSLTEKTAAEKEDTK